MPELYDTAAPRKAANLSVNSDLLHKTRPLTLTFQPPLSERFKEELAKHEAAQWVEENLSAIKSYNEFVEQHGCFGDEFREF